MTGKDMEANRTSQPPVAEAELHAFADGRLTPAARRALLDRLAQDPASAATAQAWAAQRELIRSTYAPVGDQPLPPVLASAAGRLADRHARIQAHRRLGGMAASLVFAFGVGWFASSQWHGNGGTGLGRLEPAARDFARQAAVAYAVFQPEVRHPVEVAASQQDHLLQWLSKRLGRPLTVPVFTPLGYDLVGGRLLPGDDGARAQFMYQNAAGQRITLYLGALKAGAGAQMQSSETAFRFLPDGPVPSFYWVDQGFGWALSGQLKKDALLELAQAAYRQLDKGAAPGSPQR